MAIFNSYFDITRGYWGTWQKKTVAWGDLYWFHSCRKNCGVFLQYTLFNFVVRVEDLRSVTIVSHVAEVTFVSHEWSGLQHPDPKILGQKKWVPERASTAVLLSANCASESQKVALSISETNRFYFLIQRQISACMEKSYSSFPSPKRFWGRSNSLPCRRPAVCPVWLWYDVAERPRQSR